MSLERASSKRVIDLAWEEVDAKRDLQKVRILLEEALVHIEDAATLDRDYLNGCVSSALLLATNQSKGKKK